MKNNYKYALAVFLISFTLGIHAQTIFKGKVVDAETKQPISNAKIGISDQGVGELTDVNGRFVYKKYHEVLRSESTLLVGAKGYESIQLGVHEIRSLFNTSSTIELSAAKEIKKDKKIKKLSVFWDISEGMQGRDIESEIAYIQQFITPYKRLEITLVAFNHKIQKQETFEVRNGDVSRFRESVSSLVYNGPSNYGVLEVKDTDAVILSSKGKSNFGTFNVSQDVPIYAIATGGGINTEYLQKLARYTTGNFQIVKKGNTPVTTTTFKDEQVSVTSKRNEPVLKGRITSLGKPLQEVSIIKKGDFTEYLTDASGRFEVPASEGDILQLRYLGMFPKDILVENREDLAIELLPENDILDEVVLTKKIEEVIVGNKVIKGNINHPSIPGGTTALGDFYITADDITPNAKTLEYVLQDHFNGVVITQNPLVGPIVTIQGRQPGYIINGRQLFSGEPIPLYILDSEIESIIVKDSPFLTSRYGLPIGGLFVIITTKTMPLSKAKRKTSSLVKGNEYTEEVQSISNGVVVNKNEGKLKGIVTTSGSPIQGATISRKGTFDEVVTDSNGQFTIDANVDDLLFVHSLGMYPKPVKVDNLQFLNVELTPKYDVLDEVVITAEEKLFAIKDSISNKNNGYILLKEDFENKGYTDMVSLIVGKTPSTAASGRYPNRVILNLRTRGLFAIVVDGLLFDQEILNFLDPNIIDVIEVVPSIKAVTRYGSKAGNGVIIITTLNSSTARKAPRPKSALVKGNNYTEEVQSISNEVYTSQNKKRYTGKITSLGKPIQGATISKKGTFEEHISKSDGTFEIYAQEGDELIVQYLGMYPKGFMINESTTYNIDLLPKNDVLDEVVLKGENRDDKDRTIRIALGEENRDKIGYDVKVIKKEDISLGAPDLGVILNGKFAGIVAVEDPREGLTVVNNRAEKIRFEGKMLIVIDGQIFPPDVIRPYISPDRVENISIVKSIIGANRYGVLGANGVVEITTSALVNNREGAAAIASALVEGNDYNEEVQSIDTPVQSNDKLQVRGIVKGPQGVLSDATITRKGSFDEVYTNNKGEFEIQASLDDVLVVSKVGMFAKELLVTSRDIGSVELTPKNDNLDEIIVQGNRRVDNTIETGYGKENSDKLGYAVDELTSDSFSAGATNLQQLITGKVAGVTVAGGLYSGSEVVYKIRGGNQSITNEIPPIWIVNGTPYQEVPNFLDVQQIESISVLKSVVATSRYGSLAAGGAFLIKTKESSFKDKAAAEQKSALVSGNEYDGASTRSLDASLPEYILRLREIPNIEDQFEHYQKISRTQESPLEFYVDVAQYFEEIDRRKADQVRADLAYISRNNTKALRTLGYIYGAVGDYKNAQLIYERVAKIAPQEAQSYRDLALVYQETGQYNRALELYYNMLGEQIKGVDFTGLENILRSELSHLVSLYKDKIDYERLPNEWLRIDFDVDIRMVIEWSDRSVPFEFQFVNPDKKFFKWTHTLEENRERLEAEQSQGFQAEEFIIDDAPSGEWLINIQYLGDEGDYVLPPFLKYTVYRNYGTPQETKEIKVVKLFKQSDKVTLGKVVL